jgi:hypothetical protein
MTAIPPLGHQTILPLTPHTGTPPSSSGAFAGLLDNGALAHPLMHDRAGLGTTTPPVQAPLTIQTAPAVVTPPLVKNPEPGPTLPAMPGLVVPPKAEPLAAIPVPDAPEGTAVFDASGSRPLRTASTFRFEDLGMFGKYAAEAAPGGPVAPIVQLPRQPAQRLAASLYAGRDIEPMAIRGNRRSPTRNLAELSRGEIHAQWLAQSSGDALADGNDVTSPHAVTASPTGLSAEPTVAVPLEDAAPIAGSEGGGETLLASTGAGKLPLRNAPPTSNAFNVTVAAQGEAQSGTLSVAMRGETDESYGRMRQLVEDTAAEFGLDVGDFRLNGSGTEQTFGTMLGGNRGRSS